MRPIEGAVRSTAASFRGMARTSETSMRATGQAATRAAAQIGQAGRQAGTAFGRGLVDVNDALGRPGGAAGAGAAVGDPRPGDGCRRSHGLYFFIRHGPGQPCLPRHASPDWGFARSDDDRRQNGADAGDWNGAAGAATHRYPVRWASACRERRRTSGGIHPGAAWGGCCRRRPRFPVRQRPLRGNGALQSLPVAGSGAMMASGACGRSARSAASSAGSPSGRSKPVTRTSP